jgi:hypothetical protein
MINPENKKIRIKKPPDIRSILADNLFIVPIIINKF